MALTTSTLESNQSSQDNDKRTDDDPSTSQPASQRKGKERKPTTRLLLSSTTMVLTRNQSTTMVIIMTSRLMLCTFLLVLSWTFQSTSAFVVQPSQAATTIHPSGPFVPRGDKQQSLLPWPTQSSSSSSSRLFLMEPPGDDFYVYVFPVATILAQIGRRMQRARLEEQSWELRLAEAREQILRENPTLTKAEVRRDQASLDPSVYSPASSMQLTSVERLPVLTSTKEPALTQEYGPGRTYTCNQDEIDAIEAFGVEYDPFYDDPYTAGELPSKRGYDRVRHDRTFGDMIYIKDGVTEVFYKDKDSGLYYRQGARPRIDARNNR